jgi:DNA polymerase-3 subunit delta'
MSELFVEPVDVWGEVVGQDRAVARLQAAADNPVHAYLLVGPAGSGAREAATAFAATLMGPAERDQRLVLAGEHPDVTVVERVGAAITAEQADDVIRLASLAPVEGRRKVMILDEFHLLRPEGAAKLLKTIEEPTASTVFIVVADDVPPELVTIASRCARIELGPIPDAAITARLRAEGIDDEVSAGIVPMASGNMRRARLLASDPGAAARWQAFRTLPSRLDGSGAAVVREVEHLEGLIEDAAAPLAARHEIEVAALAERLETTGERGGAGLRKALEERHRRELRRHRTDELRSGLAALAGGYRDRLVEGTSPEPTALVTAVASITQAAESLTRNPNETLLLQALLLRLP